MHKQMSDLQKNKKKGEPSDCTSQISLTQWAQSRAERTTNCTYGERSEPVFLSILSPQPSV